MTLFPAACSKLEESICSLQLSIDAKLVILASSPPSKISNTAIRQYAGYDSNKGGGTSTSQLRTSPVGLTNSKLRVSLLFSALTWF